MKAKDKKDVKPLRYTKMPIALSAFACPGVGQFVQRRWVWGLIYLGSFVAMTGVVALVAFLFFRIEFKNLTYFREDWSRLPTNNPYFEPGRKALLVWAAVYFANIFDAWYGFIRLRKKAPAPPTGAA